PIPLMTADRARPRGSPTWRAGAASRSPAAPSGPRKAPHRPQKLLVAGFVAPHCPQTSAGSAMRNGRQICALIVALGRVDDPRGVRGGRLERRSAQVERRIGAERSEATRLQRGLDLLALVRSLDVVLAERILVPRRAGLT